MNKLCSTEQWIFLPYVFNHSLAVNTHIGYSPCLSLQTEITFLHQILNGSKRALLPLFPYCLEFEVVDSHKNLFCFLLLMQLGASCHFPSLCNHKYNFGWNKTRSCLEIWYLVGYIRLAQSIIVRALLVSTINSSHLATLKICCFGNSSIESMMEYKSSFLEQDAVRTSPNAEWSCSMIADSDPLWTHESWELSSNNQLSHWCQIFCLQVLCHQEQGCWGENIVLWYIYHLSCHPIHLRWN